MIVLMFEVGAAIMLEGSQNDRGRRPTGAWFAAADPVTVPL